MEKERLFPFDSQCYKEIKRKIEKEKQKVEKKSFLMQNNEECRSIEKKPFYSKKRRETKNREIYCIGTIHTTHQKLGHMQTVLSFFIRFYHVERQLIDILI